MNHKVISLKPENSSAHLKRQEYLSLIQTRLPNIILHPLKILYSDETKRYLKHFTSEQQELELIFAEICKLKFLDSQNMKIVEDQVIKRLHDLLVNNELDYSLYEELPCDIYIDIHEEHSVDDGQFIVACHINIAILNLSLLLLYQEGLKKRGSVAKLLKQVMHNFVYDNPSSASCINKCVTASLSVDYAFRPKRTLLFLQEKIARMTDDIIGLATINGKNPDIIFFKYLLNNFFTFFRSIKEDKDKLTESELEMLENLNSFISKEEKDDYFTSRMPKYISGYSSDGYLMMNLAEFKRIAKKMFSI